MNFYTNRIKLSGNVLEVRSYANEQLRNKNGMIARYFESRFIVIDDEEKIYIKDLITDERFYTIKDFKEFLNSSGDFSNFNFNLLQKFRYELMTEKQKQLYNKIKSIYRVKDKMIDLVNSNLPLDDMRQFKLLTLTYAVPEFDLKKANEDLKLFIMRFNYKFIKEGGEKLKYIAIKEYQEEREDKSIHFHLLCFNAPYIHELNNGELDECWGRGSTNYEIVEHVKNVGLYVGKIMEYVFKEAGKILSLENMIAKLNNGDLSDDEIEKILNSNQIVFTPNHKFYSASRGLKKSVIKYGYEATKEIEEIQELCFEVANGQDTFDVQVAPFSIFPPDIEEDCIGHFNIGAVQIMRYVFNHTDKRVEKIKKLLLKIQE